MIITDIIFGIIAGLILSFTSLPILPLIFINTLKEQKPKGKSPAWILAFILFNGLTALLPVVFIIGAISQSLWGGIAFTIALYYPYWEIKESPK